MKKPVANLSRRSLIQTSALGFLGLTVAPYSYASNLAEINASKIPAHFPQLDPKQVSSVVGKSHSDFEGLRKLVEARPELAKASWEWRFGDFESAIGAASHVGRRDIALYLIEKGARPNLFTFAMLGYYKAVRAICEAAPGIQKIAGPHGISLLDHAYAGQRMKDDMNLTENNNLEQTLAYLKQLGNAGGKTYLEVQSEDQKKYLGDYKYGEGATEGFTIGLNMRKALSLGPIGGFGGALYKIGENSFTYNGSPSVNVSFDISKGLVRSLIFRDPELEILAKKIS